MLTLALDTSSTSGSIALVRDATLVVESTVGDVGTHAGWLMRNIERTLGDVPLADIDLFAATVGPGSFTGLRIGITTLKGLAWPLGKKVAGVSTLKALAMNFPGSAFTLCPVLDARKKEVYAALYAPDGAGLATLMDPAALPPSALVAKISGLREEGRITGKVLFAGGGLRVYGKYLLENVKDSIASPEPLWHVRASNVAVAALEAEPVDPALFTPVYLRKSEAELKAAKR